MKKPLVFIVLCLTLASCKPAFDLSKEQSNIKKLALGEYSNEDFIENHPKFVEDSLPIEKINKKLDSIRLYLDSIFYTKQDVVSNSISIEKISSTKRIGVIDFKIIKYSNFLEVRKNKQNQYLNDFKESLEQNFIEYSDDPSNLKDTLKTKSEGEILAFFEKDSNKWKYIAYSDLGNEALFGLEVAQGIIDLYFEDIFIAAKTKWDKESISIFKEIYEEERAFYEADGIDFDKFVNCKMKYQEKADERFNSEIPDDYFDTSYHLENSLKCRIYSKTN